MYYLPLTLDTPAANLALDEALLEEVEAESRPPGILRIWEPREYFVVLGRSSDAAAEVCLAACRREGIPIWRRPSGGGVVALGPGCLMYAVVLRLDRSDGVRPIDEAHRLVLGRHAAALASLEPSSGQEGISDLALSRHGVRLKFSGNSLRLKRQALLYHGTLLYDFDLPRIERWLGAPRRTPDYRRARSHRDFVTNVDASRQQLTAALVDAWRAGPLWTAWPRARTAQLIERYEPL